ncbi:hypothetical protein [Aquimarina algiphila]|uniref:hypothetical protein n=1 Tax=Aquimarina algiphila TaxID=2047982 RepID=UPI00232C98F1|nr:hypothetical protein [Aquimarina algiphila]
MKTMLICVFAFFSFLSSIAQNTNTNNGFGNFKNNVYQSKNFTNFVNANHYNTTNYTFGSSTGFYMHHDDYFPPVLSQQITSNILVGFDTNVACLNPAASIMLTSGSQNTAYQFSTTEIVVGSVIQVLEILSCF